MKNWLLNIALAAAAILTTNMAQAQSAACDIYENPRLVFRGYWGMYVSIANDTSENRKACVNDLYSSVLNRAADPGGSAYYEQILMSAIITIYRPSSIRRQLAESPEATALIDSAYVSLLGRNADPGGLEYWRQILAQYGYSAVVAGIQGSDEYRIRMGQ